MSQTRPSRGRGRRGGGYRPAVHESQHKEQSLPPSMLGRLQGFQGSGDSRGSGGKRRVVSETSSVEVQSGMHESTPVYGGKRRFSPYSSAGPGREDAEFSVVVSLPKESPAVDENHLFRWLLNKSNLNRFEQSRRISYNCYRLTVSGSSDLSQLLALDNAVYNSIQVRVQRDHGLTRPRPDNVPIPAALDRPETQQFLQQFVRSRLSPDGLSVNLSQCGNVPELVQVVQKLTTGAWSAILKAVAAIAPNVQTVVFDENKLRTLYPVAGLCNFCPNVLNLSFARNDISSIKSMECIQELKQVRELVFIGNPVLDIAKQTNQETQYRKDVASKFPNLQFLDTVSIDRSAIPAPRAADSGSIKFGALPVGALKQVNIPEPTRLPIEINGSWFDSQETQQTVGAFLMKYLHLFDTDRTALLDVYENQNSVFSLLVNPLIPAGFYRKDPKSGAPYFQCSEIDFSLSKGVVRPGDSRRTNIKQNAEWINFERNLIEHSTTSVKQKMDHQVFGSLNVAHLLSQLPQTQHKSPELCLVDAWQVPSCKLPSIPFDIPPRIFLNVHGEFTEIHGDISVPRFFDRSFVLIPSAAGSKAQQSGWQVQIVNDALVIKSQATSEHVRRLETRARSEKQSVKTLTQWTTAAALPVSVALANVKQPSITLSPAQQNQIQMLIQQTGLNYDFSLMCLNESAWNYEVAFQMFKEANAQNRIPPNAFISNK